MRTVLPSIGSTALTQTQRVPRAAGSDGLGDHREGAGSRFRGCSPKLVPERPFCGPVAVADVLLAVRRRRSRSDGIAVAGVRMSARAPGDMCTACGDVRCYCKCGGRSPKVHGGFVPSGLRWVPEGQPFAFATCSGGCVVGCTAAAPAPAAAAAPAPAHVCVVCKAAPARAPYACCGGAGKCLASAPAPAPAPALAPGDAAPGAGGGQPAEGEPPTSEWRQQLAKGAFVVVRQQLHVVNKVVESSDKIVLDGEAGSVPGLRGAGYGRHARLLEMPGAALAAQIAAAIGSPNSGPGPSSHDELMWVASRHRAANWRPTKGDQQPELPRLPNKLQIAERLLALARFTVSLPASDEDVLESVATVICGEFSCEHQYNDNKNPACGCSPTEQSPAEIAQAAKAAQELKRTSSEEKVVAVRPLANPL